MASNLQGNCKGLMLERHMRMPRSWVGAQQMQNPCAERCRRACSWQGWCLPVSWQNNISVNCLTLPEFGRMRPVWKHQHGHC